MLILIMIIRLVVVVEQLYIKIYLHQLNDYVMLVINVDILKLHIVYDAEQYIQIEYAIED